MLTEPLNVVQQIELRQLIIRVVVRVSPYRSLVITMRSPLMSRVHSTTYIMAETVGPLGDESIIEPVLVVCPL